MEIRSISPVDAGLTEQMERLLQQAFDCYKEAPAATEEVQLLLEDERILLGAIEGTDLLGFVGAIPQYSHAWELHPLVVVESKRGKGIGSALVTELEKSLAEKGILTIYLGTDDEEFKTSLSDGNLFDHTFEQIGRIQNRKRHPYEFYQKNGYQIVGVIPDANGPNKPDIWLAKRIRKTKPSEAVMSETWSELTLYTTTEGLEMVGAFLTDHGVNGFMVQDAADFDAFLSDTEIHWDYVDESLMELKECETSVIFYLPNNPQGTDTLAAIRAELPQLREYTGLDLGRLKLESATVHEEDWANEWKRYYRPVAIGERIWVIPSWEKTTPPEGRIPLILDPGMAFGTGTHASTRLCLELLETVVTSGCTMLDVGCGSGILAVAALLLGADSAIGVDIDELAAKISLENAARNNVQDRLTTCRGDLTSVVTGTYDVICANIVADVILRLASDVTRFLKPNGRFIASGIIDTRKEEVIAALEANGLVVETLREGEGWIAILCRAR